MKPDEEQVADNTGSNEAFHSKRIGQKTNEQPVTKSIKKRETGLIVHMKKTRTK